MLNDHLWPVPEDFWILQRRARRPGMLHVSIDGGPSARATAKAVCHGPRRQPQIFGWEVTVWGLGAFPWRSRCVAGSTVDRLAAGQG